MGPTGEIPHHEQLTETDRPISHEEVSESLAIDLRNKAFLEMEPDTPLGDYYRRTREIVDANAPRFRQGIFARRRVQTPTKAENHTRASKQLELLGKFHGDFKRHREAGHWEEEAIPMALATLASEAHRSINPNNFEEVHWELAVINEIALKHYKHYHAEMTGHD